MSRRLCTLIVLASVFGTTTAVGGSTQPAASGIFRRFETMQTEDMHDGTACLCHAYQRAQGNADRGGDGGSRSSGMTAKSCGN